MYFKNYRKCWTQVLPKFVAQNIQMICCYCPASIVGMEVFMFGISTY